MVGVGYLWLSPGAMGCLSRDRLKGHVCLIKGRGPIRLLDQARLESYMTSVLVFNLCLVLFVQVNENDVLLLHGDARKSFTRDFKNVFGTVPISCGFTFPRLLSSLPSPLPSPEALL